MYDDTISTYLLLYHLYRKIEPFLIKKLQEGQVTEYLSEVFSREEIIDILNEDSPEVYKQVVDVIESALNPIIFTELKKYFDGHIIQLMERVYIEDLIYILLMGGFTPTGFPFYMLGNLNNFQTLPPYSKDAIVVIIFDRFKTTDLGGEGVLYIEINFKKNTFNVVQMPPEFYSSDFDYGYNEYTEKPMAYFRTEEQEYLSKLVDF